MFPLQRGNELVIQFSNIPHQQQQQHKISQDLILDHDSAVLDVNDSYHHQKTITSSQQPRDQQLFFRADQSKNNKDHNKKIMIHREIEKKRRQDMATLFASLRSLLPLDFIKGKRSLSEHMNEAVNYIKYMQNNIKELGIKRDELKKLSNNSMLDQNHDESSKHISNDFTVHENKGILGIQITSNIKEERLKLSKLLHLLLVEGHDVITWFSTELNGRLVYSVQCQVNISRSLDLSELRRKVGNVIPTFRCSD